MDSVVDDDAVQMHKILMRIFSEQVQLYMLGQGEVDELLAELVSIDLKAKFQDMYSSSDKRILRAEIS